MSGAKKPKEAVLRRMLRLADRKANDAVRLVYLGPEEAAEVEKMDLGALVEFKRHANGAVEIKLVDRGKVLGDLFEMLRESGGEELEALIGAMGRTADEDGTDLTSVRTGQLPS